MMIHQSLFLKKGNWNTSLYMSSCVHLNIVIKALQQIHQTPLYMNAKISIQPNWQGLTELANATKPSELQKPHFEQEFNANNLDMFEEIAKENYGDTMVQNIIDLA